MIRVRPAVLLWVLAGLALVFIYSFRLSFPPDPYFDEVYHVKQAKHILSLTDYAYVEHPPLGRQLIALGIFLFGDHSWAWRVFPCLAGLASLYVLFLLTQKMTGSSRTAFFAGVLFAFDCSSVT